jgi:hypothetical protein
MAHENKIKHLEFAQLAITRMAANSFLLKAWTVTLVAALFAFAAKDSNERFVFIAFLPVLAFWLLDGFYLHQERLYRALYDKIRTLPEDQIDYSMDTREFASVWTSWPRSVVSSTLTMFYGTTVTVLSIVMIGVLYGGS